MRQAFQFHSFDWLILLLALAISLAGVVEIFSTTAHTALGFEYKKQLEWVLAGVVLAVVVSQIDYHLLFEHVTGLYLVSVAGLIALLFASHRVAGVRRWLQIGGMTFQVSEMVKLVIIVAVAAYLAERKTNSLSGRDCVALALIAGVPAALVVLEPDLGTALTFFPAIAGGIFLVGIRARHVLASILLLGLLLPVGWHFMRPYQRERLVTFLHPSQDTEGSGYQAAQSKIAIGSGGFWGKGSGNGTQSQLGFIPVSHADFIFAAFAEEHGFVGILFVLLLYFILLLRLLDGAQMAGDRAGALFLVALVSVLFFQVAVNVGMMIGFLPITGIPLPLMSQGGTAVLVTFAGLGVAMSIRTRRFVN